VFKVGYFFIKYPRLQILAKKKGDIFLTGIHPALKIAKPLWGYEIFLWYN
jgi:hypothetical protein